MQAQTRAVLSSHVSDRWATPRGLYAQLEAEFHFTFDPCPLNGNADGTAPLFGPWAGHRVFCNPPYGLGIELFLRRAGEAELAVFLLPARTDTRWFHELVLPIASEIRFLRGRLRFNDGVSRAPFPSMLVVYRNTMKQGEHEHTSTDVASRAL